MQGQNLWISLLVTLQIASTLCQTSSNEITTEEQYAGDTYHGDVGKSVNAGISITLGLVTVVIFVVLFYCICYRYVLRCRKQTQYSGLVLGNNGAPQVNVVQVVQQSPQQEGQNGQRFPQQNQGMEQPKYPPMQHFPPQYQPMPQFPPHNHPMQQFPPHDKPMQQFSPQHSPMQQFSPQNQPMQQFSPQHSPMQQFQQPGKPSQNQSSSSENFANFPEPPPAYEHNLPRKY